MDFIDSQIESPAKAFTESFAFARYASPVTPVHAPRTVYLFKWLAIFQDGVNHFMISHANSTDGWQKSVAHNVITDAIPTPHDVTYEFTPPLIGNPAISGDPSITSTFGLNAAGTTVSNPVSLDAFLNQMIGLTRIAGSMKQIIDAGALQNLPDGGESFWSYKDNISEGVSKGFDPTSTIPDRTAVTGDLQQVDENYAEGVIIVTGMRGQPVSYVGFDDLGEVLIAQTLAPALGNGCIMVQWILTNAGPQFPVVTGVDGQMTPYLIPIPDVKTIWIRAASILPYTSNSPGNQPIVIGIANKLYPKYATEADWRAAGANF